MKTATLCALLCALLAGGHLSAEDGLRRDLGALLESIAVSGREGELAAWVVSRLPAGARIDRLGNVLWTQGRGSPRRLIACGLDEPGLIVSEVREDGYLRVRPTGRGGLGPLWAQGFEGQKVWISTGSGRVAGAVAVPSIHLNQGAPAAGDPIFGLADAYVDVGAGSREEVREQGIRELDPVALYHRVTAYGEDLMAGPAARSKAACAALLRVADGLAANPVPGTTVLAWSTLERWNRKGIEHLVAELGPFDEALLASLGFGWRQSESGPESVPLPEIGQGLLSAGEGALDGAIAGVHHLSPRPAAFSGGPEWGEATIGYWAVSARYPDSAVETVALRDVEAVVEALLERIGSAPAGAPTPPSTGQHGLRGADSSDHAVEAALLSELIGVYGVSGDEARVREAIAARLPDWAVPRVDAKGNLRVEFGAGEEHVAFVAHLDEVGFEIEEILDDGRLRVGRRGGLSPSLWEGQAALVHTPGGPVPGVFETRPEPYAAEVRSPPADLTVYLGASTREQTTALGIAAGQSVTMPKEMARMGRHRAVARGFDDRVGSSAQLLALARIDPETVARRVTFAWVVEEETGLHGSLALAEELIDVDRIHPVDTFVSSHDPFASKGFALAPLGSGAVLRAMDNSYLAPLELIEHLRELAAGKGIPVQVGFTGGGNDGVAFIAQGARNLPLSWPGRSSHSPAEVMDFRDLEALVDLIVALVEE